MYILPLKLRRNVVINYIGIKRKNNKENPISSNLWGTRKVSRPLKTYGRRGLLSIFLFSAHPLSQVPYCLLLLWHRNMGSWEADKEQGWCQPFGMEFLFPKSLPQWYHLLFPGLVPPNHYLPGKYPSLSPTKVLPTMVRRFLGGRGNP